MRARVWRTLVAAQEAPGADVCSHGERGVGVNRKGSLGDQSSMSQMKREIGEVKRIKDRIADQMVDIPVPPVMEEIVAAVQEVMGWSHRNGCGNGSTSSLWRFQFFSFLKRSLRW